MLMLTTETIILIATLTIAILICFIGGFAVYLHWHRRNIQRLMKHQPVAKTSPNVRSIPHHHRPHRRDRQEPIATVTFKQSRSQGRNYYLECTDLILLIWKLQDEDVAIIKCFLPLRISGAR
jgi:hypothetical protein